VGFVKGYAKKERGIRKKLHDILLFPPIFVTEGNDISRKWADSSGP